MFGGIREVVKGEGGWGESEQPKRRRSTKTHKVTEE
jgi:hypothetical protein